MDYLTIISETFPRPWLADWFELASIKEGSVRFDDYLDEIETGDTPSEDVDGEECTREDVLSRVLDEVNRRIRWLGDSYPFALADGGLRLQLKSDLNHGMNAYLLCLWLSAKSDDIITSDHLIVTRNERNLFQACSTLCAAAFLGDHAFSFGFPRPEGTGILRGLSDLHAAGYPEGAPKDIMEAWMNSKAKDDEVDVIAWRRTNDSLPGVACFFGQSASGENWTNKPLSSDKIRSFQTAWYKYPPGTTPLRGIFIPFCPYPELMEDGEATYSKRIANETITYGIFFTRYRLPYYVGHCLGCDGGNTNLNHHEIIEELRAWSDGFIGALRV